MLEFRADEKTAEKLTEIADTLDISRSDLLLSMVKFALTNHQWARFGLTHKTLPRYEENPIMATKKFSPAQIAAQKLFAERARAGTLGKTVKRKAVVKRNPVTPRGFVIADDYTREIFNPYGAKQYDAVFMKTTSEPGFSPYDLTILKLNSGEFIAATGSKVYQEKFTTAAAAANWLANWYKENKQKMYRGVKTNPSTNTGLAIYLDAIALGDTYSESKLMEALEHPALSASDRTVIRAAIKGASYSHIKLQDAAMKIRNYKGGRKTNPDKAKPRAYVKRASQATGAPPSKRLITRRKKALTAPAGYFPNPKVKYTNRAKDMKGDQRVGYAVHMADRPSYQAIAWFSKKDDAVKVAQEASDRTGKQLAVTRVQNYFGAM